MKKNRLFFKNSFLLIILIFGFMFLSGCYSKIEEFFYIEQIETISIKIGDELTNYSNITCDENNDVLGFDGTTYYGKNVGSVVIRSNEGIFLIEVNDDIDYIYTNCNQRLLIGETTKIDVTIYPLYKDQKVIFKSSNEEVITVDSEGNVTAIDSGVCNVTITSAIDQNYSKDLTFIVLDKEEEYFEKIIETIIKNNEENKDLNNDNDVLQPIIDKNINSLIGISASGLFTETFASGIVYKMNIHFNDNSVLEDVKTIDNYKNIKYFEYYVITNRHIVKDMTDISVYLGNDIEEEAQLIEYDDKIDLAVIKFKSNYYVPVAIFGDSSEISKGEFIISIGNGRGKEYFRTSTFGILSGCTRYISVDTDNDNVSDWDSEYLQHDASLNESDSGGAVLNLKGEIIGINTTKITNYKYNNMSFAIPSNLVLSIVSQLEQGIKPQRLQLGIQIIEVSKYQLNKEYYLSIYPFLNIPDDLKYGFCITNITEGGFAYKANMQVGDIIIKFNDVDIKYTYQLRSELGKYFENSGDVATVIVLRNGIEVELKVVF